MANIALLETPPDSAVGVLAAARAERRAADAAEANLCRLAVAWAVMHPADSMNPDLDTAPAVYYDQGGNQTDVQLAGPGAPSVGEYAVAEFATTIGLSEGAGRGFLGECLELRYRLPRLWKRVMSGSLAAWKARLVARQTIRLSPEAAGFVDRHVAPSAHKVRPAQLDRLVNQAIGRFMPDEVERLAEASWDKRHLTIHDQLVSFTGTMTLQAELDIADALDLETAVAAGAAQRADLGSTESLDVRRAQAVGDLARGQLPLDLLPDHLPPDPEAASTPPRKAPPRHVVLYVHLSDAALRDSDLDPVARIERGNALVTVEQVRAWCGRPDTQ
ncbi:MAG TPA: HNH endonuclease, partial [Nocardioides sp.]|nr:HNH endonuclease [Nocardioides sp.]